MGPLAEGRSETGKGGMLAVLGDLWFIILENKETTRLSSTHQLPPNLAPDYHLLGDSWWRSHVRFLCYTKSNGSRRSVCRFRRPVEGIPTLRSRPSRIHGSHRTSANGSFRLNSPPSPSIVVGEYNQEISMSGTLLSIPALARGGIASPTSVVLTECNDSP